MARRPVSALATASLGEWATLAGVIVGPLTVFGHALSKRLERARRQHEAHLERQDAAIVSLSSRLATIEGTLGIPTGHAATTQLLTLRR